MEFSFHYEVKPVNLLILGLTNIYRSMMGLVNIIFTLSMVLLAYRFWPVVGIGMKIPITAAILLFPFFQPLFIYLRSRRIVSQMPDNLQMTINNKGIDISSESSSSHINYTDLKSITRIRGILILYTRTRQGFLLNTQTLDGKGDKLYDFLSKKADRIKKK